MYNKHFGLREAPFSITPDTTFSFASGVFQEALNTLLIAVKNGEGFIKITGEVGTGKTLLCRKFLASLDESFITAYIPNPYLEPRTLLIALAEELNLKVRRDLDQHLMLKALTLAMLDFARQGKRVLVCLDEAQAMPLETLETLYNRVEDLRVIGGGAKADIRCQIVADIMNRNIHRVVDPQMAGARGVALLASRTLGYIDSFEAIRDHIPVNKVFKPNPELRLLYDRLFREFKSLYKQNKKWYKRMNRSNAR